MNSFKPYILILVSWLVLFQAQAQVVDTSVADSLTQSGAFWAKDFRPNPKKATIYAAVFPGLGQIYNRKYWKLPIVYGGFLGLAYAISWNGKYYNNYKDAYISIMDTNEDTNAYLDMLPPNVDPNDPNLKSWLPSALQRSKDNYRRWRDMSIAGVAALYALSVIDAYVDAQMFDFDISPDLSMKVEPVVNTGYETASVGAKLQLNF